jgi:hypothetical protein
MFRWIYDHTRKDRVRNTDICDKLGVAPIEKSLTNIGGDSLDMSNGESETFKGTGASGILRHDSNGNRDSTRLKLTREETVK